MQCPGTLLAIIMTSVMFVQCGSKNAPAGTKNATAQTPTEKLVTDLKAEYGMYTRTFYDSLQHFRFIEYSYKDNRDKPDLFRKSIDRSLNLAGKEVNIKYDVSSATKVNLGEYVWETPAYRVNLHSGVKASESPAAPGDSVFVRLWIME